MDRTLVDPGILYIETNGYSTVFIMGTVTRTDVKDSFNLGTFTNYTLYIYMCMY